MASHHNITFFPMQILRMKNEHIDKRHRIENQNNKRPYARVQNHHRCSGSQHFFVPCRPSTRTLGPSHDDTGRSVTVSDVPLAAHSRPPQHGSAGAQRGEGTAQTCALHPHMRKSRGARVHMKPLPKLARLASLHNTCYNGRQPSDVSQRRILRQSTCFL